MTQTKESQSTNGVLRAVILNPDIVTLFGCCRNTATKKMNEIRVLCGLEGHQSITVDNFLAVHSNFSREAVERVLRY